MTNAWWWDIVGMSAPDWCLLARLQCHLALPTPLAVLYWHELAVQTAAKTCLSPESEVQNSLTRRNSTSAQFLRGLPELELTDWRWWPDAQTGWDHDSIVHEKLQSQEYIYIGLRPKIQIDSQNICWEQKISSSSRWHSEVSSSRLWQIIRARGSDQRTE
jgi:hypothetical protein